MSQSVSCPRARRRAWNKEGPRGPAPGMGGCLASAGQDLWTVHLIDAERRWNAAGPLQEATRPPGSEDPPRMAEAARVSGRGRQAGGARAQSSAGLLRLQARLKRQSSHFQAVALACPGWGFQIESKC